MYVQFPSFGRLWIIVCPQLYIYYCSNIICCVRLETCILCINILTAFLGEAKENLMHWSTYCTQKEYHSFPFIYETIVCTVWKFPGTFLLLYVFLMRLFKMLFCSPWSQRVVIYDIIAFQSAQTGAAIFLWPLLVNKTTHFCPQKHHSLTHSMDVFYFYNNNNKRLYLC